MRFTLNDTPFAGRSGSGVTVAVLDSGVHATHPHVGGVQGGVAFTPTGDLIDRIGHGTAVAAAIREKAPSASLLAVKVFDRRLATNVDVLARAIVRAADDGAAIVNLSLGTANPAHVERLADAVAHATTHGALVVSARRANDVDWFPGSLASVIGVVSDDALDRDEIRVTHDETTWLIHASPFPRPIPNVPRERNLFGVSFAVANTSGFLARAVEDSGSGSAALAAISSLVVREL